MLTSYIFAIISGSFPSFIIRVDSHCLDNKTADEEKLHAKRTQAGTHKGGKLFYLYHKEYNTIHVYLHYHKENKKILYLKNSYPPPSCISEIFVIFVKFLLKDSRSNSSVSEQCISRFLKSK